MGDFSGSIEEVEGRKQWKNLLDWEMKDFRINHLLLQTLNWKDFPCFYGEEKQCLFTALWFLNAPLVFLDFKKEHRRQFMQ